jgi:hypothetical protein
VTSVGFNPDGRQIVAGLADGSVRVWPGPAAWSDTLCAKLTQKMTPQQWDDWVAPTIDDVEACPDLSAQPTSGPP